MRKLRYFSALQAAINYRWHLMGDKSRFVPFSRTHKIACIKNWTWAAEYSGIVNFGATVGDENETELSKTVLKKYPQCHRKLCSASQVRPRPRKRSSSPKPALPPCRS